MKNEVKELINYKNKWVIDIFDIKKHLSSNHNKINLAPQKIKSPLVGFFFILGLLKIIELYFRQRNHEHSLLKEETKHLVADTSHGYKGDLSYRHSNYFLIFNPEKKIDYLIFDCFDKKVFTKLIKLDFKQIYTHLKTNYQQLSKVYNSINSSKLKSIILLNSAKNLGTLSYFCAFFEKLSKEREDVSLFHGGAVFISHAASLSSIKNHYLTHGLVPIYEINPLTLPRYDSVYIYSKEEKNHIEKLLPDSQVEMYPIKKIKNKNNKIIFFVQPAAGSVSHLEQGGGVPEDDPYKDLTEINKLIEVIELLQSFKYELIIKYHPSYTNSDIIDNISNSYQAELISDKEIKAHELIYTEKPSFTVNWASTSVCESLISGVIPLCLSDPKDSWVDEEVHIYPFKKRSLFWEKKEDKEIFISLLKKKERYEEILNYLNYR